ncbi:MAG: hypothetical protein AB8G05_20110 [Oligoflexales bacterium]
MFKNILVPLSILLSYSPQCFSKIIEIPLIACDAIFFDSSESGLMDESEKEELKDGIGYFFLSDIAPDLLKMGIPWTHKKEQNIHDLFHTFLKTFANDSEIFLLKVDAEDSYSDLDE